MSAHSFLPRSMLFEAFRLIDSDCLAGVKDLKLMCWAVKCTAEFMIGLQEKKRNENISAPIQNTTKPTKGCTNIYMSFSL